MSFFAKLKRMGNRLSPFSSPCRYARLCRRLLPEPGRVLIHAGLPSGVAGALQSAIGDKACVRRAEFSPRELAAAQTVFAAAPPPDWYSLREGQELRLYLPDGGASFGLSVLLSASVLAVSSEHLPALKKRLGPIYAGQYAVVSPAPSDTEPALALQGRSACPDDAKPISPFPRRLLVYGGSLAMNGVTTSLIYRLRSLDPARYDVTLLLPENTTAAADSVLSSLPEWVRILPSSGCRAATLREWLCWWQLSRRGGDPDDRIFRPLRGFFKREARRRVGCAAFDAVIDYSGYGAYYPLLFMQIPCGRRLIWQHNDIQRDMTNREKGRQRRYRYFCAGLSVVTRLYPQFDRVVSASQAVWEQNRLNFAVPGREETFVWCSNLIDAAAVRQKAAENHVFMRDGRAFYGDGADDPDSLRAPVPDPTCFQFVTMGRLSPEKNQDSLIRAFARLSKEDPTVRLTLIGSGEWEEKLRTLSAELGVADKVTFTGDLHNPFAYLKYFDAFVFVSHYEAMGLAVVEARILGLPILLSDYSAAASVSVPGGQIMVGQTSDSIYHGLRKLKADPSKAWAPFDEAESAHQSKQQFDALFAE